MEQQHRHRLSNNIASANHHAVPAADFHISGFQQLHHSSGSTGQKMIISDHDPPHVLRMERIYVLERGNGLDYFLFVQALGQGKLN